MLFRSVAHTAREIGVSREVVLPEVERARAAAFIITAAEGGQLHLPHLRTRRAAFDPLVRDRLTAGVLIPAAWYLQAQRVRRWFSQRVREAFREFDVLLAPATPCAATVAAVIGNARRFNAVDTFQAQYQLQRARRALDALWSDADLLMVPTAPRHPTHAQLAADPVGVNAQLGRFTNFVNLLGWCALAMPAGRTESGLPSGSRKVAHQLVSEMGCLSITVSPPDSFTFARVSSIESTSTYESGADSRPRYESNECFT